MPFDINNPASQREQQRRLKKSQETSQQQVAAAPPNSGYDPVTTVDTSASGTLPTSTVLYLSGLSNDQRELARLGRMFARTWNVTPQYLWGTKDASKYISPITGKPLSMHEARIFASNFGAVPVTSMLQNATTYSTVNTGSRPGGLIQAKNVSTTTLDPKTVGKFAKILADHNPDLELDQGMGMSVYLTREGYDPKRFSQNLTWINQWLEQRGSAADKKNAVNFAIRATEMGESFHSMNNVVDWYAPGARKAKATAQQTVAQNPDQPGAYAGTSSQARLMNIQAGQIKQGKYFDSAGNEITPEQAANDPGSQFVPSTGVAEYGAIGPDYWSQVQQDAHQIALDQNAMENSWFKKNIMDPTEWVLNIGNLAYKNFWAGSVLGARYAFANVGKVYGDLGLGNLSGDQQFDYWIKAGRWQATRLYSQQETPGSLIAEPMGDSYKHYVGGALDLLISWELDPTVIAGKVRGGYEASFLLPDLLEHSSNLRTALEKVPVVGNKIADIGKAADEARGIAQEKTLVERMQSFAGSKISRQLFEAPSGAKGTSQFNRIIHRMRGKVEANGLLDLPYMTGLRDKIMQRYGMDVSVGLDGGKTVRALDPAKYDEAWQEWQQGIMAHLTHEAPAGSVAAEVVNARDNLGFRAQKTVDDAKPIDIPRQTSLLDDTSRLPETDHQALIHDAMDIPATDRNLGWLRVEVPGSTRLSEYGPRRAVRSLITSEKFTETRAGKAIARLPVTNPGRVMEVHDNPTEYIYNHAAYTGSFTESESQVYASRAAAIENSGYNTEGRLADLAAEINRTAYERLTQNINMTPELKEKIYADLTEPVNALNGRWSQQAFGALQEGEEGTRVSTPLFESQLRNSIFVADPQAIRAGVRRYISMRDRLAGDILKTGKEIGIDSSRLGHAAVVSALDKGGEAYRLWLRAWKTATVARPAYFFRVIALDENARFLSTASSLGDRLLALGFGHRNAENPNIVKRFLDDTFKTEIQVGDSTVPILRAGAFEYSAAAAGKVRESDIINEAVRGSNTLMGPVEHDGSWGLLKPTVANETQHLNSMSWDLVNQIGQSEPGKVALHSIAAGEDVPTTIERLKQWAREDNFTTLRTRMGVDPSEVDIWADKMAKVVHGYTMDSPSLARVALEGDRTKVEDIIRHLAPNVEDRPIVHAPTVGAVSDGNAAQRTMSKFTNWWYDWNVRRPEDAFNRQPYNTYWERQAQSAMYRSLGREPLPVAVNDVAAFHLPGRTGTVSSDINLPDSAIRPREAIGDGEGYLYHVSPSENFDGIKATGLEPRVTFEGNLDVVPPEMRTPRLFFADSAERAKQLSWKSGDNLVYRVKADNIGAVTPERSFSGSQYTFDRVSRDKVEVLAADGNWYPLTDAGHYILPAARGRIEDSARRFALGQVRRVMFDFTKQSRFTELLQVAFPFPQPFFEGFQAWGHIAYRNPTAIAHGRLLFQAGVQSGLFKKDPISGEYMVPAAVYTPFMVQAATRFGGDPRLMKHLASVWMPLANMNMLTSSSIKFGSSGPIGRIIGGVPIPMPGLAPVPAWVLMKAFGNSKSPVMQGYLFQYGPQPQNLPALLKVAESILWPSNNDDNSSKQSMQLQVVEALHRFGLDMDENGNPIPLNAEEAKKMGYPADKPTLMDIAKDNTDALFATRGLLSLFAPTTLRTAFQGQREDYAAFQGYLDAAGGDYTTAADNWLRDNPDKFLIPAGKTLAGPGYDGQPGVRVPPSELTYQMMRSPGVGDFMHAHPEWAALLLIGTDPKVQNQQNFAAFADLIAKGMISYKTADQYYQSGADAEGWQKFDVYQKTIWYPQLDKLIQEKGSESAAYDSLKYTKMKADRQQFFADMYRTDPHWVLANLEPKTAPDGSTVYDYPDYAKSAWPAHEVRADATKILATDGLQDFPGVQALQEYMDGTNAIQQKMNDKRITDINSEKAKDSGLWDKYTNLTQDILAKYPDFEPFLTKYFGVRISDGSRAPASVASPADVAAATPGVISTDDLVFNMSEREWAFSEVPQNLRDQVIQLDTHLSELKNAARENPMSPYQQQQAYAKVDNVINNVWREKPAVLRQWWKAQGTSYQQDYREYVAIKPPEFYTAFDFHIAGVKLSKTAASYMDDIAQARLDIAKGKQDAIAAGKASQYSSSAGYDAIDAYVRQRMTASYRWDANKKKYIKTSNKPDPTFVNALETINTPGWGIDHILKWGEVPGKDQQKGAYDENNFQSKGDWMWAKYLRTVRSATDALATAGYTGVNYGSDNERKIYLEVQNQARQIARHYQDNSPQFDQMWKQLQEQNGALLVGSLFFPDDFFGYLGQGSK